MPKVLKNSQLYYGRNVLKEALKAKASITTIFVETKSAYDFVLGLPGVGKSSIQFEEGIPKQLKGEVHQGVAFRAKHDFYKPYSIEEVRKYSFVILCNHIDDIYNLGSIARCAAGFGADLIIHENVKSCSVTAAAVKSSAGCAFRLSFMKVPELLSVSKSIKKNGFSVVALDLGAGAIDLYEWEPSSKVALILGSEQNGVGPELLDLCDQRIRISMKSGMDSLNVSHAASIAMSWVQRFSSPAKITGL